MAKSNRTGNQAKAGITGAGNTESTENRNDYGGSKFREAADRISRGERTSKDEFIHAYIATRANGGSPEEATDAGRKAAGFATPSRWESGAEYAVNTGDAYLDEKTGRVRLYDSVNKAVGGRTYCSFSSIA